MPERRQIFVAMPFQTEYEPIWNCIREAAFRRCLYPYRVDREPVPGDITQQIQNGIRESLLVVADLSGQNVNVAFESGVALALGKPLVLLVRDLAELGFDFRNMRAILYAPGQPGLARLQSELVRYFDYQIQVERNGGGR